MTLSERYKNRKILKEQEATPNQEKPPEEKIEELRGQLKEIGRSIKIPSLKNSFAEAIKEIAKFETKEKIDLSAEWNLLKPKMDAMETEAKSLKGAFGNQALEQAIEQIEGLNSKLSSIETLIDEFKNKDELKTFFKKLKKSHDLFDDFVETAGEEVMQAQLIKFVNKTKEFVKDIESFMEKFEDQAKLDPKKIIEKVEKLITQTKDSMEKLGKFLKDGNYVTDDNKEKTLGDILKPAEPAGGGASAPATAPTAGGAA
jgi:hypothetical protein